MCLIFCISMNIKTKKFNSKNRIIKILGCVVSGSFLLIYDQTRRIRERINNIDVSRISRLVPEYIYFDDPILQAQLEESAASNAPKALRNEKLKLVMLQQWFFNKMEESAFGRKWLSFKKNIAWRFLSLAQCDIQSHRIRAVQNLAAMQHLTDSDFQQLAQSCDVKTAVGLARIKNIDLRFFLDPPFFKSKPTASTLLRNLHNFLLALDRNNAHPCLKHFITKAFPDVSKSELEAFHDEPDGFKVIRPEIIPTTVEAILHHSWIEHSAKSIITLGGLPLLMEIYKYVIIYDPENVEALIMLSKLLSNMSVFTEYVQDFFVSGWIKILAKLSQHKDLRVSVPAARALMNFDTDGNAPHEQLKYYRHIYQMHPTHRTNHKPAIDVVTIHGLLGGAFITWRQRDTALDEHNSALELLERPPPTGIDEPMPQINSTKREPLEWDSETFNPSDDDSYELVLEDIPIDSNSLSIDTLYCSSGYQSNPVNSPHDESEYSRCWPKDWLSADCPDIRLIGVNYETNISMWSPKCPNVSYKRNLNDRCTYLLQTLTSAGVGKRPIVWLTHSMGGLIIKEMLVQARASNDPIKKKILENTRAIVFFSTPHKGSHLADLNQATQMILWPSIEVQELKEKSPALLELHNNFLQILQQTPIQVVSFAERKATYITSLKFEMRFVKDGSSDADVGELYGIPLDHLCICKPACRHSFLYQRILKLVQDVIESTKQESNQS